MLTPTWKYYSSRRCTNASTIAKCNLRTPLFKWLGNKISMFPKQVMFCAKWQYIFSSEPGFNARILNVLYGRNSLFVFALMCFPYLIMEFWKYIFIFKETENAFSVTKNIYHKAFSLQQQKRLLLQYFTFVSLKHIQKDN